jgi:hypothetical protein
MRTSKQAKWSTTLLLLIFCAVQYGQNTDTVTITLTVDTSQLGDDRNAPGGCTLSAVPNSVVISDDGNPKNFAIQIKNGTELIWEGYSKSGKDVKIKKIGYVKGINIFDRNNIPGTNIGGKEKVKAKAKRKTATDLDYEYLIEFRIKGFGRYTLDPRIKVN